MYMGHHVRHPPFSWEFNENLNFLDKFSKNTQIPNFMKIRPMGAKLFQTDGLTGTTKQTVAFRNLPNAPNNDLKVCAGVSCGEVAR